MDDENVEPEVKDEEEAEEEEGDVSSDRVEKALDAVAKMEVATVEMNKASSRLEKLRVDAILGGKASAGNQSVKKSKEQVVEDNAFEYLKGSGMEDEAFPDHKK